MAVLTENSSSRYQIWFRLSFLPKVYVVASFHTCLEDCVTARDPVNRASGCWYTDIYRQPVCWKESAWFVEPFRTG